MYFNKRLFSFTLGFRTQLAAAVLLGLLTATAGVSRLALSGYAVALVFTGSPNSTIIYAIAGVFISIVVRAISQYFKEMTGHRTALGIQIKLRRNLYSKALELGPGTLDQKRSGDMVVSLVEGVDQLESYFGEYIPQLFVALLTPFGLFTFMAFLDLPTALIYLIFALVTLVGPAIFHKWNENSSKNRRTAYGDFSAEFLDSIQGLATLKAFGQSESRALYLGKKARHVFRSTMKILAANQGTTGVTWFGITVGAAVALAWGAVRVSDGSLELTTLLIVVMLGVEVFRPVRELTTLYHRGMLGMASATAVFDLLDSEPLVKDVKEEPLNPETLDPSLEYKNVSFKYPTRDVSALSEVSFKIKPGETVAVVGASGAGKSTLVWLALRFFDPSHGQVLIGGYNLANLPLSEVRKHISVVSQDTYLFHGTVAENLRIGKPGGTQEELENAAHIANAHSFISALPDGYATVIGERGIKLSGGQRQRIAIARALLKNAPILILDEALSSVDTQNEAIIQEALNDLMESRTTMVIAHRLSSVVHANHILVLKEGRLVESGNHDNLLERNGFYTRLMESQSAIEDTDLDEDILSNANQSDLVVVGPENQASKKPELTGSQRSVSSAPTGSVKHISWFGILSRLLDLINPWRWKLTLAFFLGVLRVFVIIGIGVASALIVREVNLGSDLTWLMLIIGALAVLTPLFHWGESWVSHDLAFRLLAQMRIDLYNKFDKLGPAYLVRRRSGDIISLVTTDVETIELFFAHTIAPAFVALTIPAAILVIQAIFQWQLSLILLPFLVFVGYTPFLARNFLDKLGYESRQQLGEINAHMVDSVQGIREIVAFGQENIRLNQVTQNQLTYGKYRLRFFRYLSAQHVLIDLLTGIGGLAVLAAGAYFVSQGILSANLLPLLSIIALSSFIPVSEVAETAKQLTETLGSARRVFGVHDEKVLVTDGPGVRLKNKVVTGAIEFEDVNFCYAPGLPEAVRDLAFSIQPGQILALVGHSGAGKTTTAHLLMRFWDPTSGTITLDGHELKTFTLETLWKSIALVSQDPYLFNATIRENLKIAKPEATDVEMTDAAKQAGVHEFSSLLPQGYDTLVGERGLQLSGGQRQLISIARAFLKNAPVLVLDEATSHLDAINEGLVHRALHRLMKGRSTLVIAHRLSTVKSADKIIVLHKGTAAEQGTHRELLLNREGIYSQLIKAQVTSHRSSGHER